MNWLLIIVVAFLIICAINGYRLGFIKKLFTTLSFIITIIAASAMAPHVSDFLKDNTPIYDTIKKSAAEVITGSNNENIQSPDEAVNEMKVPAIVKTILSENNSKESSNEDNTSITDSIVDYVSTELADTIINAVSFAIAFAIITIVFRTTIFTLDIITNLPIIKGINQYAGLILGGAEGLIIVWIVFIIITVMGNTELGKVLTKSIETSSFLSFIYNNNYFYKLF